MQNIWDTEDWSGQENDMQRVESLLLGFGPGPRVVLSSEEDDWCDDVGVVGNEFSVKVRKTKEGMYSLDRGWRMPVSDSSKFGRIHANETLANNHS